MRVFEAVLEDCNVVSSVLLSQFCLSGDTLSTGFESQQGAEMSGLFFFLCKHGLGLFTWSSLIAVGDIIHITEMSRRAPIESGPLILMPSSSIMVMRQIWVYQLARTRVSSLDMIHT